MNPNNVADFGLRKKTQVEREAFIAGALATRKRRGRPTLGEMEKLRELAAKQYPNPTYERSRVIRLGHCEYKIDGGRLLSRYNGPYRNGQSEWKPSVISADQARDLVSLFERPTETVEVDV